jgi:hypothetical protein
LPNGIEVGIDYRTFIATDKFLGFKMIAPGLHFFTIKYKTAPNISFFLWFEFGNVYSLKWNQEMEDLEDIFKCRVGFLPNYFNINLEHRRQLY